ncbi:hypothetical protein [Helicobacter salomonis]|uniref:hypothetical protein n=1 Tax=Helicobacter salomonis TaxID=56878 RepID=UPI000CF12452|nr:hypothetical protein [Helicobacter salomonis]
MRSLGLVLVALLLGTGTLQGKEVLNTSLIHRAKSKPSASAGRTKKKQATPKKRPINTKKPTNVKASKNTPPPHQWIYSSVVLTAYFSDGHYKQGYGLLLQNGQYLTASSLIFDQGMYAQTIMAKMQDDSAPLLICVARLHVKAIDRNHDLSLLSTHAFTNDYCQTRPESYYHARIYKKYGQNLLAQKGAFENRNLYYPQVSQKNAFEVQSLQLGNWNLFQDTPYGRPLFSANGTFMGILSANQHQVKIIKRGVVLNFLRALKERDLL